MTSQIKVTDEVKAELDDLKLNRESYNLTIQRLINDNHRLKEDNDKLFKIAMKTEDSIAFPTIAHSTIFALGNVLKDEFSSDDEKLSCLKIYLRPNLEEDSEAVLLSIESFKSEYEIGALVIEKLTNWINKNYN